MNPIESAYRAADAPLSALLDAVPAGAWSNPSPCEGWAARDVVRHLLETEREFLTGRGVDLGAAPDVDADPAAAWREHTGRVLVAVADDELVDTPFDGFFGPTTVGETLVRFYVWDLIAHRWDVARAVGVDPGLTEEELDAVEAGADGFGEALHGEGICRAGVTAPEGAGQTARVMARLGRSA